MRSNWDSLWVLFEASPDAMAILTWDSNTSIVRVNGCLSKALKLAKHDIVGKHFNQLLSPDDSATEYLEQIRIETTKVSFVTNMATGHVMEWSAAPLDLEYLLLIGRDVTEQRREREELYQRAHFDALTGLPNRYLFQDRAAKGLAHSKRESRNAAAVFFDLDNFKAINDTWGHSIGDEILQYVGERVLSGIRETDTAMRMGDEFVVFLGMARQDAELQGLVDRLAELLTAPVETSAGTVAVEVSYGCSFFPEDGEDIGALQRVADARMYDHKVSKTKDIA
jgi:polar amino acid transport system substrate-binding protein